MTKVILIGDSMLDIYYEGPVNRISAEAPIPILLNPSLNFVSGGAANVALNLASLGLEVVFLTNIGKDDAGGVLLRELESTKIIWE